MVIERRRYANVTDECFAPAMIPGQLLREYFERDRFAVAGIYSLPDGSSHTFPDAVGPQGPGAGHRAIISGWARCSRSARTAYEERCNRSAPPSTVSPDDTKICSTVPS